MEQQKNILIITASETKNMELAEMFRQTLQSLDAQVKVINLIELDLPLFSSRSELLHKGEQLLAGQLQDMREAQGFVFIAPEYNGSTPPVFNNFLAWLSRASKNWREYLNGKPAAIATYSGGGGHHVLLAMRTQLSFIGMNILGRQILTHPNKALDTSSLLATSQELIKHSI